MRRKEYVVKITELLCSAKEKLSRKQMKMLLDDVGDLVATKNQDIIFEELFEFFREEVWPYEMHGLPDASDRTGTEN